MANVGDGATNQYDAIVIGGGHNGLTNGAYLAKARSEERRVGKEC